MCSGSEETPGDTSDTVISSEPERNAERRWKSGEEEGEDIFHDTDESLEGDEQVQIWTLGSFFGVIPRNVLTVVK